MIGQRCEFFPRAVQDEGCAFLSMVYLAWREGPPGESFAPNKINKLYEDLVLAGAMRRDCYINDWQRCMNIIAPGRFRFVGKVPMNQVTTNLAIIRYHYPRRNWYHFVVGAYGNCRVVDYDPWPRSITAGCGIPVDARVFACESKWCKRESCL